jgi:nucleoid-associated protein YgaU
VYTLEKGDTLWDLAETHYGHGKFYRRIVKANPGIKPNAGNKFTIPAPVLPRSGAESSRRLSTPNVGSRAAKRVPTSSRASASADFTWYKVKPNDTLMALAKQFYDDSSKYEVIEKANRTVKYQGLQAGSTIKIPSRKRKQ